MESQRYGPSILSGVLKGAFISESKYDQANATKIHKPIKYH